MDQAEVINIVRSYRNLLNHHLKLENVYLFGSYARNTNREDSDIDVAIVVKRMEGDYFSITPLLWKLRRQINSRIEPVLIESENDISGFLEEIKKYGIEVV